MVHNQMVSMLTEMEAGVKQNFTMTWGRLNYYKMLGAYDLSYKLRTSHTLNNNSTNNIAWNNTINSTTW